MNCGCEDNNCFTDNDARETAFYGIREALTPAAICYEKYYKNKEINEADVYQHYMEAVYEFIGKLFKITDDPFYINNALNGFEVGWVLVQEIFETGQGMNAQVGPILEEGKLRMEKRLQFCCKAPCGCVEEPTDPIHATSRQSPIILDLDGDGVETVSVENGVYFDHDGNLFAEKTGWAGADDAFLVWDRNGNGLIDDGSELFGSNFILSDGRKAAHGFEALAEFDSNGDGVVDHHDDRWGELMLWQDKNGDGVVDDGEMLTLAEAGVAGLNVDYLNKTRTDANGNQHRQIGTFIRDDGSEGGMNDVWFAANVTDSLYIEDLEISGEIVGLPNLKGYGHTPSLHQAMALDESGRLQSLMEQFVDCDDPLQARSLS